MQSVLYSRLVPAPAAAPSLASAISGQFYAQQASLILSRESAETRNLTLQGTTQRAFDLQRAASSFFSTSGHDAIFANRNYSSSDESKIRGYATDGAAPKTYQIDVLSTFAGQPRTVISNSLDAGGSWSGPTGSQSFRLTMNGTAFNMTVDTTGLTSNRSVLEAIQNKINDQTGMGVKAHIQSIDDKVYLDITSDGSKANSFTITDVSGSLMNSLRTLTNKTANPNSGSGGVLNPESAIRYRVDNGPVQTTTTGRISLDNGGLNLSLLDHTVGAVTVSTAPNSDEVLGKIEDFVEEWNGMFEYLTTNPGELTTPLAAQLERAAGSAAYSLKEIGIDRQSDGTFVIDEEELSAALSKDPNRLQSLLAGPSGLATTASRLTTDFLQQPASYETNPINPVAYSALREMTYNDLRGMLLNTIG